MKRMTVEELRAWAEGTPGCPCGCTPPQDGEVRQAVLAMFQRVDRLEATLEGALRNADYLT